MVTLLTLCAVCAHWIITGHSLACEQTTPLQFPTNSGDSRSCDSSKSSPNSANSAKSK